MNHDSGDPQRVDHETRVLAARAPEVVIPAIDASSYPCERMRYYLM